MIIRNNNKLPKLKKGLDLTVKLCIITKKKELELADEESHPS